MKNVGSKKNCLYLKLFVLNHGFVFYCLGKFDLVTISLIFIFINGFRSMISDSFRHVKILRVYDSWLFIEILTNYSAIYIEIDNHNFLHFSANQRGLKRSYVRDGLGGEEAVMV